MSCFLRGVTLRLLAYCAALAMAGCRPSVREDRTITFGADGTASFQHGMDGVFVTDPATGKPRRVYEMRENDIAASPPLWDVSGKRMLFAVARSDDSTRYVQIRETPAEGRRIASGPVQYTCWLYNPATEGCEKLFDAACGHAGQVATGTAVAWSPDGTRIDHIDQRRDGIQEVRSFDLETRESESAQLPPGGTIVLGYSHSPARRAAVLGDAGQNSGLWVDEPANHSWSLVPESTPVKSGVENLRRMLPRWSRDGTKLAFLNDTRLQVYDCAARTVALRYRTLAEEASDLLHPDPVHVDFFWHPDNLRIGLFEGSRLLLIGPDGTAKRLSDEPVISFGGWDASGTHIAYVAAEPLKYIAPWLKLLTIASERSQAAPLISMIGMPYAALVLPNLHARTAIWVADATGENPKKLLGGARATFLHWSPREPKLSVWLTVEPPYRLVESAPGMRTGDPAAIINAESGKVEWMPVNGTEHAQIGHIALRAGRVEEAIREFDQAAAALQPDGKADWMFFRAIALRKAGRLTEAEAAIQRFEPPASIQMNPLGLVAAFSRDQWLGQVGETMTSGHRFAAEAYLSLEMLDEAIEFLRGELRSAASDRERLSAAVVLGQLLLLGDRRREYAVLAADEVVPTASRVLTLAKTAPSAERRHAAISTTVALAILPLAVDGFVESLPPDTVRKVSTRFASFTPAADDLDFAIQLVLRNCGRHLKDAALTERASDMLATHPARGRFHLPSNGEVTLMYLLGCRMMFRIAEEFNERFAADVVPVRK